MPMAVTNDIHSMLAPANHFSSPSSYESNYDLGAVSHDSQYALPEHQIQYPFGATHDRFSLPTVSHGFSSWANWGGTWTSDPQCYSLKNEGLDAFTIGLDGYVYYRCGHFGILHNWVKIGGATTRLPPAVATQRDGSIDVVILGSDGILYYSHRSPIGTWQAFESLNFKSNRRPAVAPWYNRGLFIFAIGTDYKMYKLERRHNRWWYGKTAGDWVSLGGSWSGGATGGYISGPALSDSVYVLAFDMSGHLQYTRFHISNADSKLGNWVGKWINLQVQGNLAPAVAARATGFDVVVRTLTGQMAVNSYNLQSDSWVGWVHLGLTTCTIPAIASDSSGRLYIFALDNNHQLHVCHRGSQGANFGSWYSLGGPYSSSPSALIRENKYVDVFVLDNNHLLRHASTTF